MKEGQPIVRPDRKGIMSSNLLEKLSARLESRDETLWFDGLSRIAGEWGFETILFAALPRLCMRYEDAYIRSTYPLIWRQKYTELRYAYIDPVVAHCVTRSSPFVWTADDFKNSIQKNMFEEACMHGLRTGVALPSYGPGEGLSILCLVSDQKPNDVFRRDVELLLPRLALLGDVAVDSARKYVTAPEGRYFGERQMEIDNIGAKASLILQHSRDRKR
ncbi:MULTISPECIES: autoinducer binding domain-containing protein [Paraburkholderia]|uniref:autoinducer binding domain-containing protein n=1 Tax=Paraburkholderia TaxID=1822464 RepID=UPI0022533DCD|nr:MULTISPECIES: autoinducer binding domain-containing protein [Paraburkholderia]MCX4159669.1 autoinducer binding domain-containing protein [Paraburkholderia aspalathi]MDN7169066.1 autoinducer binding domain-containing protein [Paraburkholderia sp. SECH2]MDQ6397554.1 autoinducer binding domain-containing protein [Paraburkholderia aspalathi]